MSVAAIRDRMEAIVRSSAESHAALVDGRGYVVVYRPAESNRCPACGGASWHVGRATAQCAFCDAAIPLAREEPSMLPDTRVHRQSAPDQE